MYITNSGFSPVLTIMAPALRSARPGQTAHYVSDLARYDEGLNQALPVITAENPGLPAAVQSLILLVRR